MIKRGYERLAGVLLPVTMLHGPCGIGVLGREAVEFVDFLSDCGFKAWQVLPVEHTGAACSPYKSVSAFAGEPMLIDPRELLDLQLITQAELDERMSGVNDNYVDYGLVYMRQKDILRKAFARADKKLYKDFNPFWLDNYALYMAVKSEFNDAAWYEWPDKALRAFEPQAVKAARERLADKMDFFRFVQWLFDEQWAKIRTYAEKSKITIIGDMPFYVSEDSAEVWSGRDLFEVTADGKFSSVAGAPPDYFNPDGQRWGNPVYNWERMEKTGYKWWIDRTREAIARYHLVRLDHFRGFESYWKIPAEDKTARSGKWIKGPGAAPFKAMEAVLGALPVIAEDLGEVGEEVQELLDAVGYRGMKVLQFGFMGDRSHLPHNYPENCVAYTGTHDNTTLLAWTFGFNEHERNEALFYLGFDGDWRAGGPNCKINTAWIRALYMSPASMVIVPVQDLLGYGADTRTNIPGTAEGNWRFRINSDALQMLDRGLYRGLNRVFGR